MRCRQLLRHCIKNLIVLPVLCIVVCGPQTAAVTLLLKVILLRQYLLLSARLCCHCVFHECDVRVDMQPRDCTAASERPNARTELAVLRERSDVRSGLPFVREFEVRIGPCSWRIVLLCRLYNSYSKRCFLSVHPFVTVSSIT